jgi:hypothetical protein
VLKKFVAEFCLVTTLALGNALAANAFTIVNGDFSTGDFSGWTIYTTANGTNGPGFPVVSSFDVSGAGAQNAAQFKVGEVSFLGGEEGGGLTQSVDVSTSGLQTFTADVASEGQPNIGNSDAGVFSLLVNGTSIASWDSGGVFDDTNRDVLSGTYDFTTPGEYDLSVLVTRSSLQDGGTPYQYVTDISLTGGDVTPEPSPLVALAAGFTILTGIVMVRRRSLKSIL